MKKMKNLTNQIEDGRGGKSVPNSRPPGKDGNREPKEPEPSKQPGRPTPSGVPNEGRRAGSTSYRYKGGRQGTGGIPNPDDRDDRDSAGSFRGTAEKT
jgi:hypothetical protein